MFGQIPIRVLFSSVLLGIILVIFFFLSSMMRFLLLQVLCCTLGVDLVTARGFTDDDFKGLIYSGPYLGEREDS